MPGQAMTEAYSQAQENKRNSYSDTERATAMAAEPDAIMPGVDGSYKIHPITCFSDCIAIAPLPSPQLTSGGIALPTVPLKDAGIVVGVAPLSNAQYLAAAPSTLDNTPHRPSIGQVVLYSQRSPVGDLTGKFPEYGNTRITVVRLGNVFAVLPQVNIEISPLESDESQHLLPIAQHCIT